MSKPEATTTPEKLKANEEVYALVLRHAPMGIVRLNAKGVIQEANLAFCRLLALKKEQVLNKPLAELYAPGFLTQTITPADGLAPGKSQRSEIYFVHAAHDVIAIHFQVVGLSDAGVLGLCLPTNKKKTAIDPLYKLAYYDPLTELPNRRLLLQHLAKVMTENKKSREYLAVLMLDLDNFKTLNDTQGHDLGDRLLIEVAGRLLRSVRQKDLVVRLGGDEYVVVTDGLGVDRDLAVSRAKLIAHKFNQVLHEPYHLSPNRPAYRCSTSVGVAIFKGQELSIDAVMKQADIALYHAKSVGRNQACIFNPELQEAINTRTLIETALRMAIDNQEFELHYQPQLDAVGNVIGAEALLRWLPKTGATVSPGEFIPLAEENGLSVPIGEWVLKESCAQLKAWQSHLLTRGLTLSINVGAKQFHHAHFVEQVFAALDEQGVDPTLLKIELTEKAVLSRFDEAVERMVELKKRGIQFSLDDFGTGYSCLTHLQRLPVDEVKIDHAIVGNLGQDAEDATIVRTILAMCKSLGLTVIAEGVETAEQHSFLLQYGCERYQGHLYGKAVPIASFKLERHEASYTSARAVGRPAHDLNKAVLHDHIAKN